jgi:hypothetical protein
MQEQKIYSLVTVAALISHHYRLIRSTVFAAGVYIPHLIQLMDSVCEDPMSRNLNEPSRGTARRHEVSQIEARLLICVVKTVDAGGSVATRRTEAGGNLKPTAAGGSATCDVQGVRFAGAHETRM